MQAARTARTRDWLMILVAFWHGLRASEVVALTRDDIADGQLSVSRLKGSNHTIQPLIEHADELLNERPALIEYAAKHTSNQRLFPIGRQHFWRLFRHYCKSAGIPGSKAHPHVLKHSIAMQTIHSAGIENVRQYLGHKSIASTGAYLKVTDEEASASVRRAIDKL